MNKNKKMKERKKITVNNCMVLLPHTPTKSEKFAAKELALFYTQATGKQISVVREQTEEYAGAKRSGAYFLSVGNTDAFEKSGVSMPRAMLDTDGVRVVVNESGAFLNSYSESGKIYAVYEFLSAEYGFDVYAEDEIFIEHSNGETLKTADITDIPDFDGRDVHNYTIFNNALLSLRMRSNGVRVPFPEEAGEGSAWSKKYWCHTTFMFLPPERYAEKHPAWYSANKKQLCFGTAIGNDAEGKEMRETFLENLKAAIAEEKHARYFMIGQEDVAYSCDCPKCRTANEKYGGEKHAACGTLLVFVNYLARKVKKWLKHNAPNRAEAVKLVIFAYQKTQQPPVTYNVATKTYECHKAVKPENNVMVRFAPLASVYSKDFLNEEYNESSRTSLLGWSGIGAKLSIWEYGACFGGYLYPQYSRHVWQKNCAIFKSCGVKDVLMQGAADTAGLPFMSLQSYVFSHLLWKADSDIAALTDDFTEHYFKAAAKEMKKYLELVEANFKIMELTKGYLAYAGGWETRDNALMKFYPKEILESELEIIARAKSEAKKISDHKDRAKVLRRIRIEELSPRFILLDHYRKYYDKAEQIAMIKSFASDAKELDLKSYREGVSVEKKTEAWLNGLSYSAI